MVMTKSAPRVAWPIESAMVALWSRSSSALERVRFQTVTSWLARGRLRAIAMPILPSPRNAIFMLPHVSRTANVCGNEGQLMQGDDIPLHVPAADFEMGRRFAQICGAIEDRQIARLPGQQRNKVVLEERGDHVLSVALHQSQVHHEGQRLRGIADRHLHEL